MQEFDTSREESGVDEDDKPVKTGVLFRSLLKRLVVFLCFGPGLLSVLWIIGRVFKR
mgnify:CR=1 FL=1